jgi:hypothetical protein
MGPPGANVYPGRRAPLWQIAVGVEFFAFHKRHMLSSQDKITVYSHSVCRGISLRNLGKMPDLKDKRPDFSFVWHALGERILGWVLEAQSNWLEEREVKK